MEVILKTLTCCSPRKVETPKFSLLNLELRKLEFFFVINTILHTLPNVINLVGVIGDLKKKNRAKINEISNDICVANFMLLHFFSLFNPIDKSQPPNFLLDDEGNVN